MKEIHFYKDGLIESCYGWHLTHNSIVATDYETKAEFIRELRKQ